MTWEQDAITNVVEQEYRYHEQDLFKAHRPGDNVFQKYILTTFPDVRYNKIQSKQGEVIARLKIVRRSPKQGTIWSIGLSDYYGKRMKIVQLWYPFSDRMSLYGFDDPDNSMPEGELIDLLIRLEETSEKAKKIIRR